MRPAGFLSRNPLLTSQTPGKPQSGLASFFVSPGFVQEVRWFAKKELPETIRRQDR